jgi:hypothetical protein
MRKLLTIFCVIGFVGSTGLWGVSCFGVAYTYLRLPSTFVSFGCAKGYFSVAWVLEGIDFAGVPAIQSGWSAEGYEGVTVAPVWQSVNAGMSFHAVMVGLWAPMVVFAARPVFLIVRRYHRRRHNLCVACAYNLEGLTEGRCPECGGEVA